MQFLRYATQWILFPVLLITFFTGRAQQNKQALIEQKATALLPQVIEWRRYLHQHPELSNREVWTGKFIAERLRELGFEDIRTEVARTGVVALLKGLRGAA